MIYAEEKFALREVHHQGDKVVAAALNFDVVAFCNPVNTEVHLGSTGHANGDFLAQKEVRMPTESFGGVDGVMVGHGDDGHALLLKAAIDFRRIVVRLPADSV